MDSNQEASPPARVMRAKLQLATVERGNGYEKLTFHAVAAKSYPADGSDEDNTYAKYSPSAQLVLQVNNKALHGMFNPGDKFYVDFTPAPQ